MNGIWIRSQSKGLYLCKGFDPPERKEHARYENKPYVITGYVSDEIQPWLGWYATEARALEVLDEIQGRMYYAASLYTFSELTASDMKEVIFQMPTE